MATIPLLRLLQVAAGREEATCNMMRLKHTLRASKAYVGTYAWVCHQEDAGLGGTFM